MDVLVPPDWLSVLETQGLPWWFTGKESASVEEGRATHSSILAWRIPWTEEPGNYSSQGHVVGHD